MKRSRALNPDPTLAATRASRADRKTVGPVGRPLWRGVSHQYAFFVSLLAGLPLVLSAATPRASFAVGVYVASLAGLLGTSALYHRVVWPPRARYWMGQVDVSMIFVLIAGSFTPIVLLLLQPGAAETAFWAVWAVAAAAIAFNLCFRDTRKAFRSIVFVVVGAAGGIALLPSVVDSLGATAVSLRSAECYMPSVL